MFRSAIIGAILISATAAPPATAQTVAPITAPAVLVISGGQASYRARE